MVEFGVETQSKILGKTSCNTCRVWSEPGIDLETSEESRDILVFKLTLLGNGTVPFYTRRSFCVVQKGHFRQFKPEVIGVCMTMGKAFKGKIGITAEPDLNITWTWAAPKNMEWEESTEMCVREQKAWSLKTYHHRKSKIADKFSRPPLHFLII